MVKVSLTVYVLITQVGTYELGNSLRAIGGNQVKRLILVLLALMLLVPRVSHASAPPEISSIAYLLYDADFGRVLVEKNGFERRSIASITKVMTILYAVELIEQGKISLADKITASARAESREGTQIKLRAGETFTVEELLYAAALQSANDAAVVLAEYIGGSEEQFAAMMNERARELGLEDTNYVDCTGLQSIFSGNYSTAYDQARLFSTAMGHELFREIFGSEKYFLQAQRREIKNSHPLLGEVDGVEGGKTGATTPAGHTLITSTTRRGRRLISVVLGARTREARNAESESLIEWAFDQLQVVIPKDTTLTTMEVPDGVRHEIGVTIDRDVSIFAIGEDPENLTTEVILDKSLRAPIDRGEVVGELILYSSDGSEYGRMPVVAQHSTGLASWLRRIYNRLILFLRRVF